MVSLGVDQYGINGIGIDFLFLLGVDIVCVVDVVVGFLLFEYYFFYIVFV